MVKATSKLLGITRDGYYVYDREGSYFQKDGYVSPKLLKQSISKIFLNERNFRRITYRYPQVIGKTKCVSVTKDDTIVMVYRKGRDGQTPMVKFRNPEACQQITMLFLKQGNNYTLITAFLGTEYEIEPWDKSISHDDGALARSKKFWSNHAIIYNEDEIDFSRTTLT